MLRSNGTRYYRKGSAGGPRADAKKVKIPAFDRWTLRRLPIVTSFGRADRPSAQEKNLRDS